MNILKKNTYTFLLLAPLSTGLTYAEDNTSTKPDIKSTTTVEQQAVDINQSDINTLFKTDKKTILTAYNNGTFCNWKNDLKLNPTNYVSKQFINDWSFFNNHNSKAFVHPDLYLLNVYASAANAKKLELTTEEKVEQINNFVTNNPSKTLSFQGNIETTDIKQYNNLAGVRIILKVDGKTVLPEKQPGDLSYTTETSEDESGYYAYKPNKLKHLRDKYGKIIKTIEECDLTWIPTNTTNTIYKADFNVNFPLLDAKEKPYITNKSKNLELHIYIANKKHTVTYNLASIKKTILGS